MIAALIEFLGYLAFAAIVTGVLGYAASHLERRPPTAAEWIERHTNRGSVPDSGQPRERHDA